MNAHPTGDELLLFLRGGLRSERVGAVMRHLRDCARCRDAALPERRIVRAADALLRAIDPAIDEHPALETMLTPYVSGTLAAADARAVEVHLESCETCREDVGDLRSMESLLSRKRSRNWLFVGAAAAAAVAGIAIAAVLLREPVAPPHVVQTRPTPPAPPPRRVEPKPRYARAEWNAAVEDALRRGSIEMPATLAALMVRPDPMRAASEIESAALSPAGAVIDDMRPTFRWRAIRGATYTVSVFANQELVAESPQLSEPRWQIDRELRRGEIYEWQVAVILDGIETILPAPPAPPALFRILDADAHEELQSARAAHGGDPLLLGVLYARHGMRAEAERELRRVETDEGRTLLKSVQEWEAP